MPSSDDPFSLVIFGASGDLAFRKLIPALWSLYAARTLPEPFTIVGTARTEMSDQAFRDRMREGVKQFARLKVPNDNVWSRFASSLVYVPGDPLGVAHHETVALIGARAMAEDQRRARLSGRGIDSPGHRSFAHADPDLAHLESSTSEI